MTVTDEAGGALDEPTDAPRLGRNISALSTGQLITWSTGIAATAVIPRVIGPATLGTLVTATAVTGLLAVIAGFVTVNYLVRELVARPGDAPSLLASAIALRVALVPVFFGSVALYAYLVGDNGEENTILFLVAAATALNLLCDPMQAQFQARERMEYVALSGVLAQSSNGLVGIALVLVGVRAIGLATSMVAVSSLALVCNHRWMRRLGPVEHRVKIPAMLSLARRSLPYMAIGVALLVYTWIDTVILSLLAPAEVVGWYGVCIRLFATLLFVPTILCTAWFPRLVGAHQQTLRALWDAARPLTELVLVLAFAVWVAAVVGAQPIIHLVYGAAYDRAVPVMMIIACCVPPMYLGIVFGNVLVAAGRPLILTTFMAVGAIANAGLNLVMIPLFQSRYGNGGLGAALSLLATELLITSVGFAIVGRHVLHRASYLRACRAAMAAASMAAVAWIMRGFGVFGLVPAAATFVVVAARLHVLNDDERLVITQALGRLRARAARRDAASSTRSVDTTP